MPTPQSETPVVVLYVEDHPVNAQLMQAVFALRPRLQLVLASDGASALALAPGLRPALLLLDLGLPDCHGTDLLPALRATPGWENVTAIAVTAEVEFDPTDTGFADVWFKPLRLPTLLARLDRELGPDSRLSASRPQSAPASTTANQSAPFDPPAKR